MSKHRGKSIDRWEGLRKPKFSKELIEEVRDLFQKQTDKPLTNEDAKEMLENLTGYFMCLHLLDREQKAQQIARKKIGTEIAENPISVCREQSLLPTAETISPKRLMRRRRPVSRAKG
ncbi:hypothetical protein [Asticcacaulis sp. YBE204]|uniref:hypothetical protein n=1 Tax=Asticcacaulis sp. YBE204 TaxID=1282363 RepID=UPI0003C3F17E|nr:hypothetical protein [Asticcacaulis sp. YBE204]ESQ80405.1 hypothetical protein AEYBE204_03830 [Asticcacaulis sp. YBE204]